MSALDWSQCPAVESVPGKVSGAWVFCGTRMPAAPVSPERGIYVDQGRARTSRLVWALSGRNTARPWDRLGPAATMKRMQPVGSPPLTGDERRTIIEWIDLGAQFNALPSNGAAARASATGGQR